MDNELTNAQSRLLEQIAKNEGFEEYIVEVSSGAQRGDNYQGVIKAVCIKCKNGSKTLNLIFKCAPTQEAFRYQFKTVKAFDRESFMYETIFPKFLEFQNKYHIKKKFDNFPKYYGKTLEVCEESLALDNLKKSGYSLWNRKLPMPSSHLTEVLLTYARFHSISLAMKTHAPEEFKEVKNKLCHIFEDPETDGKFDEMVAAVIGQANEYVKDNNIAKQALEKLSEQIQDLLFKDLRDENYKIVVCHSDNWCNNMLFKYQDKDNKCPIDVKLIDFQLSSMMSPAVDLAYFMCTNCDIEDLNKTEYYLKMYHDCVAECLRNFNCDPEVVFPFRVLKEHWKKYAKFGLYMVIACMNIFLSDSEDIQDITEVVKDTSDITKMFMSPTSNNEEVCKRITNVAVYMYENGLV